MIRAEVPGDDGNEVIKIQELLSDCARRASRMGQREWEEKERWIVLGET